MRCLWVQIVVCVSFFSTNLFAFSTPIIRSVATLVNLPRATHHGLLLTIEPVADPNLQSWKVEVSRNNGATWMLFSDDIRPYDARHLLLPYRTKNYGLSTNVSYVLRLCANYVSQSLCAVSSPFQPTILNTVSPLEQLDVDNDILPTIGEYNLGTDPRNPDSDDDQMADGFETGRHLDPNLTERPDIEVTPTSLDFGAGEPNGHTRGQHQVVTVTNHGERVLRISNGVLVGAASQFRYFNQNLEVVDIPPHQHRAVPIDFLPTLPGLHEAELDILSDDRAHFPVSIALRGVGQNVAHLAVTAPQTLSFGSVPVGAESAHQTIGISNPDSDQPFTATLFLRHTLNMLVLPHAVDIAPGGREEVEVFFAPKWSGSYEGMLEIRGANVAGNNLVQIPVTATATGALPQLRLAATGLVFGNVPVGTSSPRQLVIFNDGDGILYIKQIDFGRQGHGAIFRSSSHNLIVPPHGSSRITVIFQPAGPGPATSQLCLVTNDTASSNSAPTSCQVIRSIGQGLSFPAATHAITLSGVGQ